MAGILYETDSFINQVVNKAGVATVKVFGGNPLVMGNPNATDSGLRDLTVYATPCKIVINYCLATRGNSNKRKPDVLVNI